MVMNIKEIEEEILAGKVDRELVARLFKAAESEDYITRHRAFHVLKQLKSQLAVPFMKGIINRGDVREEDVLRILDIAASLSVDTPILFKGLLHSKNPYLVRGEVMALARNGSFLSLDLILDFAASNRGRIIRRELFSEAIGYMTEKDEIYAEHVESRKWTDSRTRGYLRDMEIKGPSYNRLSVYPSNDYWALKAREKGIDYGLFKNEVEKPLVKKSVKKSFDILKDMR